MRLNDTSPANYHYQGFKIILTTPSEFIQTSRHTFRLPLLEQAELSIKSKYITTSDNLRNLDPIRRQCFFSSERRLRFFKFYTQLNCEVECLSNYTQLECGCVKFSMPRTNQMKICGAASLMCYKKARETLFGEDIIDGLKDKRARLFRENCMCLPACTSITYDANIVRSNFGWKGVFKSHKIPISDEYVALIIQFYFC